MTDGSITALLVLALALVVRASYVACPSSATTTSIKASQYGCTPTFIGCRGPSSTVIVVEADCNVDSNRVTVADCRWDGVSSFSVVVANTSTVLVVSNSSIASTSNAFGIDASNSVDVTDTWIAVTNTTISMTGTAATATCAACILASPSTRRLINVSLALISTHVTFSGFTANPAMVAAIARLDAQSSLLLDRVSLVITNSRILHTAQPCSASGYVLMASLYLNAPAARPASSAATSSNVVLLIDNSLVSVSQIAGGSTVHIATYFSLHFDSVAQLGWSSVTSSSITVVCGDSNWCTVAVASVGTGGSAAIAFSGWHLRVGNRSSVGVKINGPYPNFAVAGAMVWYDVTSLVTLANMTGVVESASEVQVDIYSDGRGGAVAGVWTMSFADVASTLVIQSCTFAALAGATIRVGMGNFVRAGGVAAVGVVAHMLNFGVDVSIIDTWVLAADVGTLASCSPDGYYDCSCAVVGFVVWANSRALPNTFSVTRSGAIALDGAELVVDVVGAHDTAAAVVGLASRQWNSALSITTNGFWALLRRANVTVATCTIYNCAAAAVGVAVFKSIGGAVSMVFHGLRLMVNNGTVTLRGNTGATAANAVVGFGLTGSSLVSSTTTVTVDDVVVALVASTVLCETADTSSAAAGGVTLLFAPLGSAPLLSCTIVNIVLAATTSQLSVVGPTNANFVVVVSALGLSVAGVIPRLILRNVTVSAFQSALLSVATRDPPGMISGGSAASAAGLSVQASSMRVDNITIDVCGGTSTTAAHSFQSAVRWTIAASGVALLTVDEDWSMEGTTITGVRIRVSQASSAKVSSNGLAGVCWSAAAAGLSLSSVKLTTVANLTGVTIAVVNGSVVASTYNGVGGKQVVAAGVSAPYANPAPLVADVDVSLCDSAVSSTYDVLGVVGAGPMRLLLQRSTVLSSAGRCIYATPMISPSMVADAIVNCARGVGLNDSASGGAVSQCNVTSAPAVASWGFASIVDATRSDVAQMSCPRVDCVDVATPLWKNALRVIKRVLENLLLSDGQQRTSTASRSCTATRRRTGTRFASRAVRRALTHVLASTSSPPHATNVTSTSVAPQVSAAPSTVAASTHSSRKHTRTPTTRRHGRSTTVERLPTSYSPPPSAPTIVQVAGAQGSAAVASATVAVVLPSAASRPSRLAATSQLAQCSYDASKPSLTMFPVQVSMLAEGAMGTLLGSSVLWTCTVLVLSVALHLTELKAAKAVVRQWTAIAVALTTAYFTPTVTQVCAGLVLHNNSTMVLGAALACMVCSVAVPALLLRRTLTNVTPQGTGITAMAAC